jgi:hypothetical protein
MKPTLALVSFIALATAASVSTTNTPDAVAARDADSPSYHGGTEPAVDERSIGGWVVDKGKDIVVDKGKDKAKDKAEDKVQDKAEDKGKDVVEDKAKDKAKEKPDVDVPKPKNDDKDKDKSNVNVNVKPPKGGKDGDKSAASGLMGVDVRVLVVGLVGAGVGAVFL